MRKFFFSFFFLGYAHYPTCILSEITSVVYRKNSRPSFVVSQFLSVFPAYRCFRNSEIGKRSGISASTCKLNAQPRALWPPGFLWRSATPFVTADVPGYHKEHKLFINKIVPFVIFRCRGPLLVVGVLFSRELKIQSGPVVHFERISEINQLSVRICNGVTNASALWNKAKKKFLIYALKPSTAMNGCFRANFCIYVHSCESLLLDASERKN